METLPTLLFVEDDPLNARVTTAGLAAAYSVKQVSSAEAALDWLADHVPDVALFDVLLPEMDGYALCAAIRQDDRLRDIPVIFVSSMDAMDDRLRGYQAGGDDFLVKPVALAELQQKIGVVLRYAEHKRGLRENADSAFRTAMTAMSSAAELGLILHFFRESFGADSYTALGRLILATLSQLGLEASLQLRSRQGNHNLSPDGICSPLEVSILGNVRSAGRLVDLGSRTAINYDRVTIIIKNMPLDDAERYGRLRDVLAQLAEGVDARLLALDDAAALRRRNTELNALAVEAESVRTDLDYQVRQLEIRHRMQIRKLVGDVSEAMVFLGLTNREVGVLRQVLDTANLQIEEVSDLHRAIDGLVERLTAAIRRVASDGADSAPAET